MIIILKHKFSVFVYTFYCVNVKFTTFDFNKVIEPDREATFEYYFTPSETFSSRQFGLTINVNYRALVSTYI